MYLPSVVSSFIPEFKVPVKELLDNFNEIKSTQSAENKGSSPEKSFLDKSNVSSLVPLHML